MFPDKAIYFEIVTPELGFFSFFFDPELGLFFFFFDLPRAWIVAVSRTLAS